jgi:hypothetical protein
MAIQAVTTTTFTTSDGKKFKDEDVAKGHEAALGLKGEIDAFCQHAGIPLTVPGKDGKERRNPGIKKIATVVGKWNDYLNAKAA